MSTSLLYAKKLTTKQAAEALGVTPAAMRYWRHKGIGPRSITVGSSVRYIESDLEEWLEAQNAA